MTEALIFCTVLVVYNLWKLQRHLRSIDCVMRVNKLDDLMALWVKQAKEANPSTTHLNLDTEQLDIVERLKRPLK